MRPLHSPAIAGALGALSLLPATSTASGPVTVNAPRSCYVSIAPGRVEPVTLSARGFDPGSPVAIKPGGGAVTTVLAGPDGALQALVQPPYQRRGERRFRIVLRQRDDSAHRARVESRVSALSVRVRPRAADPRSVVTWRGRGFTGSGPVYVHYVKDGRLVRTVRLAGAREPCGTFRTRRPQFPFQPAVGAWRLQVDQQRSYAPVPETPFVALPVTVRRVAGAS